MKSWMVYVEVGIIAAVAASDWYDRDYYTVTPDRNPPGPSSGHYKVMRGGGWSDGGGQQIMNFFRNYADPEIRAPIIGFRCAKSAR